MRKRSKATPTGQDVKTLPDGRRAMLLIEHLTDPAGNRAQSILAGFLAGTDALPLSGPGRPRNAAVNRAALAYISAIDVKNKLRAAGYHGMPDDGLKFDPRLDGNDTLLLVAQQNIPEFKQASDSRRLELLNQIRQAVDNQRRKKPIKPPK